MISQVTLYRSDEGFAITVPGLPGCCSQGATEAEAMENIAEAIREYLEVAANLAAEGESREVASYDRSPPLSLAEILPSVSSLSRHDKLQLIRWLAVDLAGAEEPPPIQAGQTYSLISPDRAFDAAAVLLQALKAERGRP